MERLEICDVALPEALQRERNAFYVYFGAIKPDRFKAVDRVDERLRTLAQRKAMPDQGTGDGGRTSGARGRALSLLLA